MINQLEMVEQILAGADEYRQAAKVLSLIGDDTVQVFAEQCIDYADCNEQGAEWLMDLTRYEYEVWYYVTIEHVNYGAACYYAKRIGRR